MVGVVAAEEGEADPPMGVPKGELVGGQGLLVLSRPIRLVGWKGRLGFVHVVQWYKTCIFSAISDAILQDLISAILTCLENMCLLGNEVINLQQGRISVLQCKNLELVMQKNTTYTFHR